MMSGTPGELLLTKVILDTATVDDFENVSYLYDGIEKYFKAVPPVRALLEFGIGIAFDFEKFRTYDATKTFRSSDHESPGYYIYKTNGERGFYIRHVPRPV